MTPRPVAHGEDDISPAEELLSRARRSVIALRAGAAAATGWVALPNSAVVTSRRAMGYPTEVALELSAGLPIAGRVIAADVGRDVAVVLPLETPNGVAPLPMRLTPEARLGEAVTIVSAVPGQGLRLSMARVCQQRRGGLEGPGFEIDTAVPLGAPVLDAEGRVMGVIVAPPGVSAAEGTVAISIAALQPLLLGLERPATELRERAPIYRCPHCEEPFDVAVDRCLSCGRSLPHAYPISPARAGAERLIREGLSALGVVANRARVGPRTWRFMQRPFSTAEATMVELEIDEEGRLLTTRAPVVGLPSANHEPFYRFLLTMNDQTTGELSVSVAGDVVQISCADLVEGRADADVAMRIDEILRVADEYRRTLGDTFEAPARYEGAGR